MARIEITSRDAERIAKAFSDLISARGLDRIRRKAVNEIGGRVRRETRIVGPEIFNTSAAALSIQGRAASPGSDNPRYTLKMARVIPVARIKAKARKVTRQRGGRRSLALTLPGGKTVRFRSIFRDGARFILRAAGPLRQRALGGVYTDGARGFGGRYPELARIRKEAERDLPAAVSRAISEHLSRRR